MSPSNIAVYGPATPCVKSSTLMPSSGRRTTRSLDPSRQIARGQTHQSRAVAVTLAVLIATPPLDMHQRLAIVLGFIHDMPSQPGQIANQIRFGDAPLEL